MLKLDPQHPFYKPLWVRIVVVGILAVWSGIEFLLGSPFWGAVTGGVGAYAAYELFWRFKPADTE